MVEIVKCLILATVVLAPMFILANELSADEFMKSGIGLAMAGVALAAFKVLERVMKEKES